MVGLSLSMRSRRQTEAIYSGEPSIASLSYSIFTSVDNIKHILVTHSNVVVFTTGREPVRLSDEVFVVSWTRLFERHGLKIAGGDRLAIVPTYLQCSCTHSSRR